MVYSDPFSHIELPFLNKEVLQFSQKYGYTMLPLHFHEIILSFVAYNSIFYLSKLISPRLVTSYKSLSLRTQINFDIHVVSMVNCLVLLVTSFPLFGDEELAKDTVSGYTPYGGFVAAITIGYFLWDCYVSIMYINFFGAGFVLHGLGSLFVFIQGMRPYILYYAPIFLLFELSTPFLNIHWFASHLPEGTIPMSLQIVNGFFLMTTFFSVRIVWGLYHVFHLAHDILSPQGLAAQPLWVPVSILVSNFSLDVLNVYWFYKMVLLVGKRLNGNAARKEKKTK